MFQTDSVRNAARVAFLICFISTIWPAASAYAQTGQDLRELKQKVAELVDAVKYTEALPLLEKLVLAEPENSETQFYLGFALIAQANTTKDESARKSLRVRARNAYIKAKQLGINKPIVDALIQGIPADGADASAYSQNPQAHALMIESEALFSQGKLDDALVIYQKALQLDPQLYEAALYSGDVYTQRGDFEKAEIWYQKAIAINPERETAYRYSATPLMKQGKADLARDRYVEAFITEPYSRFSIAGLTQWAQLTNTKLGHPPIEIPTDVTFDEKGDAKISLDMSALVGGKDGGSFAWISYGATRSTWRKEKFAKTYPQEKSYRHSLAEEADALRSVIALATADKKVKKLSPSMARLKKLDDEGLLEAYIIIARADLDISRDHPAFLKRDRDKLRRYVVQYVLTGGGK